MKIYEKTYENIYNLPEHIDKFNQQKVVVDIMSFSDYVESMKDAIVSFQQNVFDGLIKITWLSEQCTINGARKSYSGMNGIQFNQWFRIFLRDIVGTTLKSVTTSSYFRLIISYFPSFFPDFSSSNPFKVKYEYPYKNLNFDHLVFVSAMEERIELLELAEKQKMSINEFYDYVVNYIYCLKDETGIEKYYLSRNEKNQTGYPARSFDAIMVNKNI